MDVEREAEELAQEFSDVCTDDDDEKRQWVLRFLGKVRDLNEGKDHLGDLLYAQFVLECTILGVEDDFTYVLGEAVDAS